MEYLTPTEREGFDKGLIKGKIKGKIELTLKQLTRRLGELSAAIQKRLRKLSDKQVEELAVALLDFHSKTELHRWLREQSATTRATNGSSGTTSPTH